jgi:hypothetical protein
MRIPIKKSETIIPLRIKASFRNQNKIYKFNDDEWIEGSEDFDLRKILIGLPEDGDLSIHYKIYIKNQELIEGKNGEFVKGIGNESKGNNRIDGVSIKLEGNEKQDFDICYRAKIKGLGKTATFSNGEFCGTKGEDFPLTGFKMWIQEKKIDTSIGYNNAYFKTSHNSYSLSVKDLLNRGVRGLEFDIHDANIREKGEFEVYHVDWHLGTKLNEGGNPPNHLLSNWLELLTNWSNIEDGDHAPITLFLELKDNLVDNNNNPSDKFGLKRLDEIVLKTIPNEKLFTFQDFLNGGKNWPTVHELKGKIILVLLSFWNGRYASNEGGLNSRYKYFEGALKGDLGACFVAWIEGDKGSMGEKLKEQTCFWNCDIETSKRELDIIREREIITRVDFDKINRGRHLKTYYKKNFEAGYRCNFPSTDEFDKEAYNCVFPWFI